MSKTPQKKKKLLLSTIKEDVQTANAQIMFIGVMILKMKTDMQTLLNRSMMNTLTLGDLQIKLDSMGKKEDRKEGEEDTLESILKKQQTQLEELGPLVRGIVDEMEEVKKANEEKHKRVQVELQKAAGSLRKDAWVDPWKQSFNPKLAGKACPNCGFGHITDVCPFRNKSLPPLVVPVEEDKAEARCLREHLNKSKSVLTHPECDNCGDAHEKFSVCPYPNKNLPPLPLCCDHCGSPHKLADCPFTNSDAFK